MIKLPLVMMILSVFGTGIVYAQDTSDWFNVDDFIKLDKTQIDIIDTTISYIEKPVSIKPNYETTYMIEEIPSGLDKQVIYDGIYDGLKSWSDLNSQFSFIEISSGVPDIMISWIEYNGKHVGVGCLDCIEFGSTIELVLYKTDCKGNIIQFDKSSIRNTVAHEFGHNLGLEHHTSENHLMHSFEEPTNPYDSRGYHIPKSLKNYMVGQELYQYEIDQFDIQLESIKIKFEKLHDRYEKLKDIQNKMEYQYNIELTDYEKSKNRYENGRISYDSLNRKYDNLEMERQIFNNHIDKTNQASDDHNNMVNHYNDINDQRNELVPKINCFNKY